MGYYYSLKHTNPKSLHHIFHYSIIYITFAHIKATKNSCWLIRLSLSIFLDTSIYLSNNNNISLFEILINILVRLVKVCIYTFLNYSIRFDKSLCKRFLVRPACEGRADFCLYRKVCETLFCEWNSYIMVEGRCVVSFIYLASFSVTIYNTISPSLHT